MFSEDRAEFIASFDEYDLLIIDDLGVERSTEYAMEQMFFVIEMCIRDRHTGGKAMYIDDECEAFFVDAHRKYHSKMENVCRAYVQYNDCLLYTSRCV